MSFRRVSRIALVVVAGALVACSGDQTNPTAPDLDGLASLSAEAKGGGGKPKDDGGGSISTCDNYSAGAVTGGPYCDSQSHVTSEIGSNGNHVLNTTRSGLTLFVNLSGGCADNDCTEPDVPMDGFSAEVNMGSWLNDANLPQGLLSMEPNTTAVMVVNFRFDIGRKHTLRLSYGYQVGTAGGCAPNDPVTVTRGAGDTWEFATGASARACVIEVLNNNETVHGVYTMPLSYTVYGEQ